MAPSRRKTQRIKVEKPKAQSHHTTQPVCTPCYVRLERCPDIYTAGRCFVRGESGSGPLPATWRIPSRKDPVIIDVWSLHPNASWRRKTAKTYGKKDISGHHPDAFENSTTGTLKPVRLSETFRKQSIEPTGAQFDGNRGIAGWQSDHLDPKRIRRTDVKICKNHTELLPEGILMRREIEKKNVAKLATTEAELKQNIASQLSLSTNTKTIKTESDVRLCISEEPYLSQKCISDQQARTMSQGLATCPFSELKIKSEPAKEQISIADQQSLMTFQTSRTYTELKLVKCEGERVEEDSKAFDNIKEETLPRVRFHTHINSVEGDSVQKAVVKKGDTLLISPIQEGKAIVHVRQAVKRRKARNKRSMKRNVDRKEQSESHCCRFCSKKFSGKQYLRIHQEKMVCFTALTCKTCGKKFANKLGMFQHSKTHTQVKPYSCGHCDRRFHRVAQLRVHLVVHKDKAFTKNVCCSSCEWLTLPGALAILELRNKSSYVCKTCGKGFQLRLNGDPFQCKVCKCVFSSLASLASHKRSHKNTFECPDCGEHFNSECLQQKHSEKFHPLERPYICKQCGENFPRKSGLETHQLRHEDQWSIPSSSPNRMNDFEEEGGMEKLIDSLSKDNELRKPDMLKPVKDSELRKPDMLKPVKDSELRKPDMLKPVKDSELRKPDMLKPVKDSELRKPDMLKPVKDSGLRKPDMLKPVKDNELRKPDMLKPVKEEPCTFSVLEPYQIKTESEEMPCYPFSGIKTESDDAYW